MLTKTVPFEKLPKKIVPRCNKAYQGMLDTNFLMILKATFPVSSLKKCQIPRLEKALLGPLLEVFDLHLTSLFCHELRKDEIDYDQEAVR